MCGIIGEYRFDKKELNQDNFKEKLNSIQHRGPDGNGIWSNDHCILGHVRLSIIDLSENGAQPMRSPKGNIISYNGETYNFKELKNRVDDSIEFKGSSDTEVLINLLDANYDVIKDLRGMFAFAYYNKEKDELLLVRDQLGIKPVYYHINENRIIFGSEVKTILLDPEYEIGVNDKALKEHLILGYSLNEETLFKGIRRLGAGELLKISKEGIKKESYFNLIDFITKNSKQDITLDQCLEYSIDIHAISDVKLGMMLSGGFDSNLLLSYLNSTGNLNKDFIAFNAGLDSSNTLANDTEKALFSERSIAEKITEDFKVKLEKIPVSPDKFMEIKEFIPLIEEPICNPSSFLINEICSKARSSSNKVLFSGHGGDEIFGGYRRHVAVNFISKLGFLGKLAHLVPLKLIKSNDIHRIISSLKSKNRYFHLSAIGLQSFADGLINKTKVLTNVDIEQMGKEFEAPIKESQLTALKKMMALEFHGYLSAQNLINMDKSSMASSIEVRVPFLNLEVLSKGFSIPDEELVKGKNNKLPLRKLARQKLPSEIFDLKKSGFSPSLKKMVNSPEALELLMGEKTKKRGIINVHRMKEKFSLNNMSNSEMMQFLNLAFIEQWFRTYID